MKAAILRFLEGSARRIPPRMQLHLVAARYGQSPQAVEAWPADLFLEAVGFLPVTADGAYGSARER